MVRREFTTKTKRKAWERSGERCEATGDAYGLPEGVRCNADLNLGVEYDHEDPDANSKDNSLENCVCACPKCHHWKTNNRDKPLIAKTNHQHDMRRGIEKPYKRKLPSRPMSRPHYDNTKRLNSDLETSE